MNEVRLRFGVPIFMFGHFAERFSSASIDFLSLSYHIIYIVSKTVCPMTRICLLSKEHIYSITSPWKINKGFRIILYAPKKKNRISTMSRFVNISLLYVWKTSISKYQFLTKRSLKRQSLSVESNKNPLTTVNEFG